MDIHERVINVYNTYTFKELLTHHLSGCQRQNIELILVSSFFLPVDVLWVFFFIAMKGEK